MANKLSYYHVFSDEIDKQGRQVLLSTRSGESFVVSKTIKKNLLDHKFEKLDKEIFDTLTKNKIIVDASENELLTISTENKASIANKKTLYEVVQPSANCQLGCDYCGQDHKKVSISDFVIDRMVERMTLKLNKKDYENLSIGWFGGEPLMALNKIRIITNKLKNLAKERNLGYSASIVTNGLSLKEEIFVELASKLGVRHIEITLDGTQEFHDQRRHLKKGGESFDLILKNIIAIVNREDFKELNCAISIRCNVDARNIEGVSPLIKLLASHNLQDKIAYFYPIGVYSWAGNDAHLKSLTKEEYAKREIDWFIEMLQVGFVPGLIPRRKHELCIAVSDDSEMYDTYGNIYNCTEVSLTDFYVDTSYVLGNLKLENNNFSQTKPLSDWNDTILENKFPCHTCEMLPVCGGGCPKAWYEDLRACPSAKFNVKDRLALAYVVSKAESKDIFNLNSSPKEHSIGLGTA